jgi:hypothetical protein
VWLVVAGLCVPAFAACEGGTEGGHDAGLDLWVDPGPPADPGTLDDGPSDPGTNEDIDSADVTETDPGKPAVVPGQPVVVDEQWVSFGSDTDAHVSWDRSDVPYLAMSPCGDWGIVFRDVVARRDGQLESALVYATLGPGGGLVREPLDSRTPAAVPIQFGWGLHFDAECIPHVFQAADGGYREWVRDAAGGSWPTKGQAVELGSALSLALQGQPLGLAHHVLGFDRGQVSHLVFTAVMPDQARRPVHAWRGEATWAAVEIAAGGPAPEDWLAFAFGQKKAHLTDSRPGVHVLVRTPEGALAYQWFNDEAWQVAETVWSPTGGESVPTAGIALAAYDTPVVAFTVETRSEAGDLIGSALHWASRSRQGTWTQERVLDRAGAYGGLKATTGYAPRPAVDAEGGLHVVFADRTYLAQAEGDPWFEDAGSIRYGYRKGGVPWQFATLWSQVAPTQPTDRYRAAMRHTAVAASPDGTAVTVAGMAIDQDLKEDRTTLRLVAVPADNGLARTAP